MFVTAEDSGVVEYDQSGDGHFDGLLVYSRLKSAAAKKRSFDLVASWR